MNDLADRILNHLHQICLKPSRHVGSKGVNEAADYIEKEFRALGYTDVAQEDFPTTGWRFGYMQLWDLDNSCCEVPGALPCFFSQSAEITGDINVVCTFGKTTSLLRLLTLKHLKFYQKEARGNLFSQLLLKKASL